MSIFFVSTSIFLNRRRDVWSCIQEGLGSSKHSSNRQNNRLISLQKDLLKSAVNEANRAWNGNKSKPLPLRCETAMCMFRDDVDDPTMEGEYFKRRSEHRIYGKHCS